MSILIAILPILLLLVIIGIASKKFNRDLVVLNKTRKRSTITPKKTKWILVGYVMLLLGFMIVSFSLPRNEPEFEPVSIEKEQRFVEMYKSLSRGEKDEVPSDLIVDEWVQEVEGDTFRIVNEHSNWLPIQLVIEKVETDDNIIRASLYKGIHIINSYEIADIVNKLRLDWDQENLTILLTENPSISLSFYEAEFMPNGVKSERWNPSQNSMSEQYPILYLQVPKHLKLIADEHVIEVFDK
ncbi:hypothetical protein [Paenisporosarcina quisquiliarum]|uniref:hypothetical protein n=1 Tax=Paenisporosarcina quisquiliarum TaxID=365346 RepID=UPI0037370B4D